MANLLKKPPNTAKHNKISNKSEAVPARKDIYNPSQWDRYIMLAQYAQLFFLHSFCCEWSQYTNTHNIGEMTAKKPIATFQPGECEWHSHMAPVQASHVSHADCYVISYNKPHYVVCHSQSSLHVHACTLVSSILQEPSSAS